MQIITSHINLDFDGLASMLAVKKLYPKGKLVLPTKQTKSVERFLAIYRDSFNFYHASQIDWNTVTTVIIVDTANLQRIGETKTYINLQNVSFIIYDHHITSKDLLAAKKSVIAPVGATITLLIEEIKETKLAISKFEATIFALGLYTDTGSFTYASTTPRDLQAGSFLLEAGANLQLVKKFAESPLQEQEQALLNHLLEQSEEFYFDGVTLVVAYHRQKNYIGGLSLLASKGLEITNSDGIIFVVEMGKRIFIVARSISERINVLPVITAFQGGGHPKAASAMVKDGDFEQILCAVKTHLQEVVNPALTAKEIMSSPVKVIATKTSISEAAKMVLRYGHTGFPVLEKGRLAGIISRRDIEKAKHHGLGHAPVKAYMSTAVATIQVNVPIEEIQAIMIEKNVGRLPVLDNDQLVGIISRTDVIEALHGEKLKKAAFFTSKHPFEISLQQQIYELLPAEISKLLQEIGKLADELNYQAFLIGGSVRDLILERENHDIDIVIEGDGIAFGKQLVEKFGGTIRSHVKFGTATWKHPANVKIDLTSARTEYYDYPAALPTVEMSSLREDLLRRDFTINAMAIQINKNHFGKLIDFFNGYQDIREKKIKILYNLSFVEDPTRILRAVRFEKRFGFEMEPQTLEMAQIAAEKIASAAKPRLAHELELLLTEEHPVEALQRLSELGASNYLFGINSLPAKAFEEQLQQFKTIADELAPFIQMKRAWICYLIILFAKDKNNVRLVTEYALNKEQLRVIADCIEMLDHDSEGLLKENSLGKLHPFFAHYTNEAIFCYAIISELPEVTTELLKAYVIARNSQPKLINGKDLLEFSINQGPIFSKILFELECAFLNKEIVTREDALAYVKNQYSISK